MIISTPHYGDPYLQVKFNFLVKLALTLQKSNVCEVL